MRSLHPSGLKRCRRSAAGHRQADVRPLSGSMHRSQRYISPSNHCNDKNSAQVALNKGFDCSSNPGAVHTCPRGVHIHARLLVSVACNSSSTSSADTQCCVSSFAVQLHCCLTHCKQQEQQSSSTFQLHNRSHVDSSGSRAMHSVTVHAGEHSLFQ